MVADSSIVERDDVDESLIPLLYIPLEEPKADKDDGQTLKRHKHR